MTKGKCKTWTLVYGPPLWTRSIYWVHQSMDWVHRPLIFTTPKNIVVNNNKIKII